jgi:hypothetical protein
LQLWTDHGGNIALSLLRGVNFASGMHAVGT